MIEFDDYDMIQDEIYHYFGLIVRFNVRLFRFNSQQHKRESYYNEYKRNSKENNSEPTIMIRRNMDFFLSLTIQLPGNVSAFAAIFPKHMISLTMVLSTVRNFLLANNNWIEKDGKLFLKGKVSPITIPLNESSQWISFVPIVYQNQNGLYSRGVRMTINRDESFIDFDINGFMGLCYMLTTLNMYQAAQNILTYFGRPDPGTNRMNFIDEPKCEKEIRKEPEMKKRTKLRKFKDQINNNLNDNPDFNGL